MLHTQGFTHAFKMRIPPLEIHAHCLLPGNKGVILFKKQLVLMHRTLDGEIALKRRVKGVRIHTRAEVFAHFFGQHGDEEEEGSLPSENIRRVVAEYSR